MTDQPISTTNTTVGGSKAATVTRLLMRPRGATITDIMTATGWQHHSVRAFLSGLRKRGQTLVKEARKSGETAYLLKARAADEEAA